MTPQQKIFCCLLESNTSFFVVGAHTKSRFKLLAKLQCAVAAIKGVPPEREELQPELPQCQLLATEIWALMVQRDYDQGRVDPTGDISD